MCCNNNYVYYCCWLQGPPGEPGSKGLPGFKGEKGEGVSYVQRQFNNLRRTKDRLLTYTTHGYRHLSRWLCHFAGLGLPELALGWLNSSWYMTVRLGLVVEDRLEL